MEAHAFNFVFNALWNGKPVQLFQERCRVVMTRCHENESCSKVLNFVERLDERTGCAHEETVFKPREDVGGNKNLGCIFSEKSADWTNTFELEMSGLTDLYDVFLHGQFWVKNESEVPSRIRERDVVTTDRNRVRDGNGGGLRWRKEGEKKSFCFVVVEFDWIFWVRPSWTKQHIMPSPSLGLLGAMTEVERKLEPVQANTYNFVNLDPPVDVTVCPVRNKSSW